MSKLLIYPFTIETAPILRYKELINQYDEIIPVTEWNSWGESELVDISHFDGGHHNDVKVSSDFNFAIRYADSVLITCDVNDCNNLRDVIECCKRFGKHIFVYEDDFKVLEAEAEGITVFKAENAYSNTKVEYESKLLDIPVPVILVTGQGQQCNKFDIQLNLRKKFQKDGYIVSQFGTKEYSPLFGFEALPKFLNVPFWKKVLLYNKIFSDCVYKENPDVLIVGAPGGTMQIDDYNHEMFGESAIALSVSLKPDILIHSLYCALTNDDEIEEMQNHSKYALGANIDFFNISNTNLIFESDKRTISYLVGDSKLVLPELYSKSENLTKSIYNTFDNDSADSLFKRLLTKLQSNIEVV
ncbi:MAG: TIGR04066 family peptide maturation system protein [Oscillospiraceae bacterium]|nr:TIGR04066 family peptide maturation system protein [Oscillospiraceae bacterium]MCL2279612.1 TIGR04066 family peptide maturation system protein [Oscillospiraceae bacterium]